MGRFQKATKVGARLRLALSGTSGSGKTFTALRVGCAIAKLVGGRVAVIDSERGSARKYAGIFDFDVLELESFAPDEYRKAIYDAEGEGYAVIVCDSISHEWMGRGGALEMVDNAASRSKSKSTFTPWRDVTPVHNDFVDSIIRVKAHVIATMRSKTEYVLEKSDSGGLTPRKVGMAPVQRDGIEYEFDVAGDLDQDHKLVIGKTRCPALDGAVIRMPGEELAETLVRWLTDGEELAPPPNIEDVIAEIALSKTEADLDALVPMTKQLRESDREGVRKAWLARRTEIRKAAETALRDAAKQLPKEQPATNGGAV